MRVIFFGTPEFACPSLERLVADGHQVALVVSQPDRPAGRGRRLESPPVVALARRLGLPTLQVRRLRRDPAAIEAIALANPDLLVTAAFGQILPGDLLRLPRLGALNVHASLLPRHRGAAPIQRAIWEGDSETGITIMWMDEGLDTGDILLQLATPIGAEETAGELGNRLAWLGAEALSRALEQVALGTAPRLPQDERSATYAARLEPSDEIIQWDRSAEVIALQVRALAPEPGASTLSRGRRLKVLSARPLSASNAQVARDGSGASGSGASAAAEPVPGTVVRAGAQFASVGADRGGLVVACGSGWLELLLVQPEGRRAMDGRALLSGRWVSEGDRLGADAPLPG